MTLTGHAERRNGSPVELYFRFSGDLPAPLVPLADPFLPALLLPAMLANEPLESDLPVSARLLWQQQRAQGMLSHWYPRELHRVDVAMPVRPAAESPRGTAVGSFFSAGVDSFHTALKSLKGQVPPARLTHLIFMKGFDAHLSAGSRLDRSEAHVRAVARRLGVHLIVGSTNIRNTMDCLWPEAYQGAAMGATGLALSGGLCQVNIPSSFTYSDLGIPWGSHPLLDECWSSESVQFVHEGCESFRFEKLRDLAAWDPAALGELRVCLETHGAPQNCGHCYKCARTMVGLALLERLGVRSFPSELPADYLSLLKGDHQPFVRELVLLTTPEDRSRVPGLERGLRQMVRRRRWRQTLRSAAELSGLLPPLKAARNLVRRRRGQPLSA